MKTFLIALFVLSVSAFAQDADDIRIMNMMNDLRRDQGVKPLKFHPKLDSIADSWVKYIADSLKSVSDEEIHRRQEENIKYLHIDFDMRANVSSLTKGIVMTSISENVAFSSGEFPQDIVQVSFAAWKKSIPHYKGIINQNHTHFGFSILKLKNGRVLYLTVFARVIK